MAEVNAARAALNNAHWCDAMARAHGVPGEWSATLWRQPQRGLRYYPNAVSLQPGLALAEVDAALRPLRGRGLPAGWGFKDSFADLALDDIGFTLLFDAQWLAWSADGLAALPAGAALQWQAVRTSEALRAWEAAWWQADGDAVAAASGLRQFPPGLLADADTLLLGGWRDDRLVAGVIGHQAAGVVGLGNLFSIDAALDPASALLWCSALRALAAARPGMALVGYEREASLAAALACGARALGPLRVWLSAR